MPNQPRRRCTTPGCGGMAGDNKQRGKCATCRQRAPTSDAQGYDRHWAKRIRLPFLTAHPTCALCGRLAAHPDHWPTSRRQLLAQRVPDPDAWYRMRPLCGSCHGKQTGILQPGAWSLR